MLGRSLGAAPWWHVLRHLRDRQVSAAAYSSSYSASSSPAKKMRPELVLAMSLTTTSSVVHA